MSFVKKLSLANKLNQTVFLSSQLAHLVSDYQDKKLHSAIKYAIGHGDLNRITRGIYSFDRHYSRYEMANKYMSPSYISFYTELATAGIVFQPYSDIYLASRRSQTVDIDDQKYIYRKLKDTILLNQLGIRIDNGVSWASPERAVCDKIYLDGEEYFDNLRMINWDFMKKLNHEVYENNKLINLFIDKYES
jgi:predicted transcriptional regulator of viral defense system